MIYLLIYATLSVLISPIALIWCDRWSHAALVWAAWPVALPWLGVRALRDMRHAHRLADRRRQMEEFEQLMDEEQHVDRYLE